ncbi:MAG: TolC family protein [Bacteroidetes bacterium]|nr:TolC family protein [Bacteroidota bacterium]
MKKLARVKKMLWVMSCGLCVMGCAVQNKPVSNTPVQPPSTYDSTVSKENMAEWKWKDVFKDQHLINLIDSALVKNPDLGILLQEIEMQRAGVLRAKGNMAPTVNAALIPSIRRFGLYTMDGAGNITTDILPGKIVPINLPDQYLGLQSSWEVDLWGKLKNRKRAALARLLASVEGRNLATTQLVAEIASANCALIATDQQIKMIDEMRLIQQRSYSIVERQKEAGLTNELAVSQVRAQLRDLEAMRLVAVAEQIDLEGRISKLTGNFGGKINRDSILPVLFDVDDLKVGTPIDLLANRPDIKQSEFALQASKADVAAARAAFKPSLNITASFGYQAFRPSLWFNTPQSIAYAFVGGLTAPLLNRANLKSELNVANATQQQKWLVYQRDVLNAFNEVSVQVRQSKTLSQKVDLLEEQVKGMNQMTGIAEDLFISGRATYLEVLFAQQAVINARSNLIEATKEQYINSIDLYRALGGGWR